MTDRISYIIFKLLVYLTEIAFFLKNLTDSLNFIQFLKFPQCERSEPLFPNNHLLNFRLLLQFPDFYLNEAEDEPA